MEERPIFKPWVPQWLAIVTIISILFPSLVIFALYYNSTLAVAEYYSMDAMDIQYSVVLMYATVISYLALDSHLIKCFRLVNYTIAGIFINTVTCWVCAASTSGELFMFCRFIQGAVCAFLCNICMTLSFTLFHVTKARVMGYTIFYGSLMICVPFSAIFANIILNYFGVESVFYGFILFQVPGFILLLVTMNNRYLSRKHHWQSADWQGFVIYTAIASIVGYILVYGQQLEWFESARIKRLFLILLIFHTQMYFLFASTASEEKFYLPLFLQGVGTGSLFVPLIMNMVLSVPKPQMGLVAFLGIGARFLGFCLAIALINFFQLYSTNNSYMDMATSYTLSNEIVNNEHDKGIDRYTGVGFRYSDVKQRVEKDFQRMMKKESSLRAYMHYYSFIIGMIFLMLIYLSLDHITSKEKRAQRVRMSKILFYMVRKKRFLRSRLVR